MRIFKDYSRLALFYIGALIGIQLPVLMDQYGKALDAHVRESRQALQEFQDDADRMFGGDIQALIDYYLDSKDPVFHQGGMSIQALYQRYLLLDHARDDFTASWYQALLHVAFNPVQDIEQEVWDSYNYAVLLDTKSIAWGVVSGIGLALMLDLVFGLCGWSRRLFFARPGAGTHP